MKCGNNGVKKNSHDHNLTEIFGCFLYAVMFVHCYLMLCSGDWVVRLFSALLYLLIVVVLNQACFVLLCF